MARNSSGTMSAPGTYPPIADAIISLDDYKALIQDILNELTDSLSRSGKGGMIEALKLADGTQALPGLSFNGDATTGLYRVAAEIRLAILGALRAKFTEAGAEVVGTFKASGGLVDDVTHGNRGNGNLHTVATQTFAGFMSNGDKINVDTLTARDVASASIAEGGLSVSHQRGFASVTRSVAGTWACTFSAAQPDTNYFLTVTPLGNDARFYARKVSTTECTVHMHNPSTGVSMDCGFNLVVSR
jgi:hypothetical protein